MASPDPLPAGGGARLDRFAAEFERLDAGGYSLFATAAEDDEDVRRATAAAEMAIGAGPRRVAVRDAVRSFRDFAARAYSSRLVQTDTVFLFQSLADRPDDRVRFAASLERAVIALILWDELAPDDRATMLGPWATMAARAVGG